MTGTGYLLDNAAALAADRWAALSELYDEATFGHLTRLGARRGARCLEVGAGGGGVAHWLAQAVAPTGTVTATDLDVRWLEHDPTPNLDVVRHDIVTDPLPERSYDLVHARLLLGHLNDPAAALGRLVRTLRPGGRLLVEEFDLSFGSRACPDPETAADRRANRVRDAFTDLLRSRGADLHFGYRAARLMVDSGLIDVRASGAFQMGPAVRRLERANVEQTRDALVAAGLPEADLDAHLRDLDGLQIAVPVLVSVSGRRPS